MYQIKTFDLIAKERFDQVSFYHLIDYNNSLTDNFKKDNWNSFHNECDCNLINYYYKLQPSLRGDQHIRESINRFFDKKVIDLLISMGLLL